MVQPGEPHRTVRRFAIRRGRDFHRHALRAERGRRTDTGPTLATDDQPPCLCIPLPLVPKVTREPSYCVNRSSR